MEQSQLQKILTEGLKKITAYNKAKRDLENWDDEFRAYLKTIYHNPELIQSPKDEPTFYHD